MSEISEAYDEDDVEDDPSWSSSRVFGGWAGIVSGLRQFLCVSSVMFLPFHIPIYYQLKGLFRPKQEEFDDLFLWGTDYLRHFFAFSFAMTIVYISLSAIFIQLMGRKSVVVFCNAGLLLLALFTYVFYENPHFAFFIVILFYFLRECTSMIFYIYIVETADTTFRLFYLGFFSFSHLLGEALTYYYSFYPSEIMTLFKCSIFIAVCTTCVSIFIPESPFWLASKGNLEAAEQNFSWIRAGRDSASDVTEFDLLLDIAQRKEEEGLAKQIFSRTFAFCCSFAILLRICGVEPCELQFVAVTDFYFPAKVSVDDIDSAQYFFLPWYNAFNIYQQKFLGCFVFLIVSFIIPRKMIFLVTFVSGILLVLPILAVKPANWARHHPSASADLASISIFCHLISFAGVKPLIYIIPSELFPASSREFGVAVIRSLYYIMIEVESMTSQRPPYFFAVVTVLHRKTVYFGLAISMVGIPYLMLFMPESKGRTAYDFQEISPSFFNNKNVDDNIPDQLVE